MPDGDRDDVGLDGAGRGVAAVVVAAAGYVLVLLACAWLTAWILRVV